LFAGGDDRQAWWKQHQKQAEFVPGKGYRVAGVEGYFDEHGRPMQGQVHRVSQDTPLPPLDQQVGPPPGEEQEATSLRDLMQAPFTKSPDAELARQRYHEANRLFDAQKYAEAAEAYQEAAERAPGTGLEEDAMLMTGEAYFFANRYPDANKAFETLLKKYSNSRHLDKVVKRQFSMAQYWYEHHRRHGLWPVVPNFFDAKRFYFDDKGHAMRTLNNIRLNDPTGPLADDALMALANMHFLSGRWEDADYHYNLVRREYPESEHQFQAHLLGLQCKLQIYQGPDYDGTPLEESDKLAEQLLKQFPDQIADEAERIQRVRSQIAASQAQRDWKMASYHDARGEHRAARFYYESIARNYPTTKLAESSRQRLENIAGKPDLPPQKLPWLVNLFPESDDFPKLAEQTSETTRK